MIMLGHRPTSLATTDDLDADTGRALSLTDQRSDTPVRRYRPSLRRLASRILLSLVAIWVLLTVTFVALRFTGNPVLRMLGPEATQEQVDGLTSALGYNRPLWQQYGDFLGSVVRGEFGMSVQYGRPALELVFERIPATATLSLTGMSVGLILGAVSAWSAVFGRRRWGAQMPLSFLTAIQSFPAFFKGVLFILVFSVALGWFPTGGFNEWRALVLPAATLALAVAPAIGRVFRANLIAARQQPHVDTAVAKGLSSQRVRTGHIQRTALIPVTTLIGLQTASLLGGALIVEKVFSWPGLGQLTFQAIDAQDYSLVLAATFTIAVIFLLVNLIVDEIVRALDPRAQVGL